MKIASLILGVIVALLTISTISLTQLVGHSGAESVWKYKYNSIKDQQKLPQSTPLDRTSQSFGGNSEGNSYF